MGIETWKRLNELEKSLRDEFQNLGCPKGTCPPGPRVHLIFAHYGARVNPDKALDKWRFPSIDAYKAAEPKPREAKVAADFLGAHFLWVPTKDAEFNDLPNLEKPVEKTVEDGGTTAHFLNTNFDKKDVPTNTKAPRKIPDFAYVDRFSRPSSPTQAADAGGASPAGEDSTGMPKRRRLCLSIPGSAGAHLDVDGEATVEGKLNYPVPPQHGELRLYSVSAGFKFELAGKAVAETDPWTESTRKLDAGNMSQKLEEKSSGTHVGKVTRYSYTSKKTGKTTVMYGIAKYASEGTDTSELAARYAGSLGASRVKVYKAVKNIEGGCESVATYDGPKISWGINQWTLPSDTGELWQILAFIYDFFPEAFARRFAFYGFGVWFKSRAGTWSPGEAYEDVVVYRVPCCGPKTRSGLDAVFAAGKAAAAGEGADTAADLPPTVMKKVANAFKIARTDTTSYAMCHVFTTAGADEDIQKAQAQWMSYRISFTSPVGKTIGTVINEFLKSLGSNVSEEKRYKSAVSALEGEYSEAQVTALLGETFSDDGAAKDWIDWPTRCKYAGKTTRAVSQRTSAKPRTTPKKKKTK